MERIKRLLAKTTYFSLFPKTDYRRHIPKSAEEGVYHAWSNTGGYLQRAIEKVGKQNKPKQL